MDDLQPIHSGTEQTTDHELVKACLAGESNAWEQLLRRYERMIYAVTVRFAFVLEDRREIFQTVCCEILKNLPSLIDVVKLRPWILTITIRECNDLIRKKYQQRRLDPEESALGIQAPKADSLEIYLQSEREAMLLEALAELPVRCRQVIRLLFLGETKTPYKEAGTEFGLSKETIGSLRQRCLKKLRQILESKDF